MDDGCLVHATRKMGCAQITPSPVICYFPLFLAVSLSPGPELLSTLNPPRVEASGSFRYSATQRPNTRKSVDYLCGISDLCPQLPPKMHECRRGREEITFLLPCFRDQACDRASVLSCLAQAGRLAPQNLALPLIWVPSYWE